jgi:hypothetical protein
MEATMNFQVDITETSKIASFRRLQPPPLLMLLQDLNDNGIELIRLVRIHVVPCNKKSPKFL